MLTASGVEGEWSEPLQPIASIPLRRRRLRLLSPPTPLTPLIGRDADVAAVRALLAGNEARLVTLVGPGGIGKTRLALEVAATCAAAFDQQVAWAPVATATTPEAVAAALARAVGVVEVGAGPLSETLKAALRDARLLLVVDNFEQALAAAPVLSDLLHACPALSLLVTSRALLRVAGERPVEVLPLASGPAHAESQALPETPPAVQLFAQQATSISPAFALTPDNTPVVAEICRRLDGLPLAIELAAARSRLFPPAALLSRLDRRLPQLSVGQRDAPERHRTMRNAIAWSYGLLSPAEQSVFRCFGSFVGGCTLEAVETVCRMSSAADHDAIAVIESLIAQSLLRVDLGSAGGEAPRLTMLETVHEFAAEQLAASGDEAPRRWHAEYFLDLAARVEPTYWGDAPGYERAALDPEIGNLRAARDWAVEHGEADMALRLIGAMFDPHRITGVTAREQWSWTQRALALPSVSPAAKVSALAIPVWAAQVRSSEFDARALGEEALALARQVGDSFGVANAAYGLGTVKLHAGDAAGARELLSEALDRFRQLQASGRVGWILCHLAFLDSHDAVDEGGDPEALARARAFYDEAVALFRAIGHPRGIARSLHGVAYITYKQRDLPRALANTQEVLALDWNQGWPVVFTYLEDIADIAGRIGQAETAARLYGAADAQRERFGLPIEPPFRAEYERDAAVARRALGEAAFAAAWELGRAMEPEQAIAEALAVTMQPAAASPPLPLSPREFEVLRMLAGGLSDRAIADALFIGERTVNTHVARIYAKLGVHHRAAAIAAAISAGLVDPQASSPDPS